MGEIKAVVEPWAEEQWALVRAENEKFEANQSERQNVRKSALKKLAKLGLSDEEIGEVFG
jgi:hypothetical protein